MWRFGRYALKMLGGSLFFVFLAGGESNEMFSYFKKFNKNVKVTFSLIKYIDQWSNTKVMTKLHRNSFFFKEIREDLLILIFFYLSLAMCRIRLAKLRIRPSRKSRTRIRPCRKFASDSRKKPDRDPYLKKSGSGSQ